MLIAEDLVLLLLDDEFGRLRHRTDREGLGRHRRGPGGDHSDDGCLALRGLVRSQERVS